MSSDSLDVPYLRVELAAAQTNSQGLTQDGKHCGAPPLHLLLSPLDVPAGLHGAEQLIIAARGTDTSARVLDRLLIKAYLLLRKGQNQQGLEMLRQGLLLRRAARRPNLAEPMASPPPLGVYNRPIQIHTLGRFEVLVDEQPLQVSGKTPKKPLDLLRAIIAMGGRSVDLQALLLQVWPREGASARSSFDVALMRLRKLLRHTDVLLLDQGKLTLNETKSWVDAWSFESAVARCDARLTSNWEDEPLELYRGAFLHEHHMPCVVNMRDRLASKFQRAVLVAGEQHERAQRWDDAAQIYRRALEQDNLAEELYRRLMYCDLTRGHHLEAVKTYRRCCQALSINLQTRPSAATEALYRRVIAN